MLSGGSDSAGPPRLAVVSTGDEGLLMYTGTLYRIPSQEAVRSWHEGHIDFLLVNGPTRKRLEPELGPYQVAAEIGKIRDKRSPYYLLHRVAPAAP